MAPVRRRPTIADVARKAGLSRGTVGMVLSGNSELFRPETAALVRQAATAIGYRPNQAALATRTGRTGAIGLLRSAHLQASTLTAQTLAGVEDALDEQHLTLVMARLPTEELTADSAMPELVRTIAVDALLVNYTFGVPDRLAHQLRTHRIPAVWMNIQMAQDCVHPDDLHLGRTAAGILLERGHRHIAWLDYTFDATIDPQAIHYSFRDRPRGVQQACVEHGATFRSLVGQSSSGWVEQSLRWMRSEPRLRPTGVVVNGSMYVNAILHAAAVVGVRVPEDLSVVMINNARDQVLDRWPHLVQIPEYEVGHAASVHLIKRLNGGKSFPAVALRGVCHPGDTVTTPPS